MRQKTMKQKTMRVVGAILIVLSTLRMGSLFFGLIRVGPDCSKWTDFTSALIVGLIECHIPVIFGVANIVYNIDEIENKKKTVRIFTWFSFGVYIALLSLLTVLWKSSMPLQCYTSFLSFIDNCVYITPFVMIRGGIYSELYGWHSISSIYCNVFARVVLLIPMGIFLSCLFDKIDTWRKFFKIIISILLSIEVIQIATLRGRFQIDNIILGIMGASMGFAFMKSKLGIKVCEKIHVI